MTFCLWTKEPGCQKLMHSGKRSVCKGHRQLMRTEWHFMANLKMHDAIILLHTIITGVWSYVLLRIFFCLNLEPCQTVQSLMEHSSQPNESHLFKLCHEGSPTLGHPTRFSRWGCSPAPRCICGSGIPTVVHGSFGARPHRKTEQNNILFSLWVQPAVGDHCCRLLKYFILEIDQILPTVPLSTCQGNCLSHRIRHPKENPVS